MYRLIITADDFGMCGSVNKAIVDLINADIVLSTNVMTNMENADEAVCLRSVNKKLSIGLHWTMTTGKPVLKTNKIPSLINSDGEFLDSCHFKQAVKLGKINKKQLREELVAQYDKFKDLCSEPDYWNTHENIHISPFLFNFFIDLANELGIKKMRCHSQILVKNKTSSADKSISRFVKRKIINYWSIRAKQKDMKMPDGVLVFANYQDRYNLAEVCQSILWTRQEQIAEMYVHPSVDDKCDYFGKITEGRVKEYISLKNPNLSKELLANNIIISSFNEI